jgi:hypothetical protein
MAKRQRFLTMRVPFFIEQAISELRQRQAGARRVSALG